MASEHFSSPRMVGVFSLLLFLRVLVGLHPHSGQDNHHGSKVAYGGDYEAQRHWMELTLHLSIGEWYWYDLEYWGLDYPPLTAYISYLCGVGSSLLVGAESMAMDESRGNEDYMLKTYMRATVWLLDILLYFPAVWLIAKRMYPDSNSKFIWTVVLALSQVHSFRNAVPLLVTFSHSRSFPFYSPLFFLLIMDTFSTMQSRLHLLCCRVIS